MESMQVVGLALDPTIQVCKWILLSGDNLLQLIVESRILSQSKDQIVSVLILIELQVVVLVINELV